MKNEDDHDRTLRNEERLNANDARWLAHEEHRKYAEEAHARVHEDEHRALMLQLTETLRRLDELNHAHARATEDSAKFATQESVEAVSRELGARIARADETATNALPKNIFESTQRDMVARAEALATTVTGKPSIADHQALAARTKILEEWRARAAGYGALMALVSAGLGAAATRLITG